MAAREAQEAATRVRPTGIVARNDTGGYPGGGLLEEALRWFRDRVGSRRSRGHPVPCPPSRRARSARLRERLFPPSLSPSLSARLQGTCLRGGARSFPVGGIVPKLTDGGAGGAPGRSRLTHHELERVGHLYQRHRERLVDLAIRVLDSRGSPRVVVS